MNYKYFSDIYTGENEFQREKMQYYFDKSFREKDEKLLRHQYIALRRLQFSEKNVFSPEYINLSSLAENIVVACDILSYPSGISFIYCGNDFCYTKGSQKQISKALLNLLSNAYLYGNGSLVTVKTLTTQNHSKIEVLSGGKFHNENHNGKGLELVRNICKKNRGKFFIEQSLSHTKAIMAFERIGNIHLNYSADIPDVLTLISDRLSPVCVEMFGMEYH